MFPYFCNLLYFTFSPAALQCTLCCKAVIYIFLYFVYFDGGEFKCSKEIYPPELKLKKENSGDNQD